VEIDAETAVTARVAVGLNCIRTLRLLVTQIRVGVGPYSELPTIITAITRPYCHYRKHNTALFLHASALALLLSVIVITIITVIAVTVIANPSTLIQVASPKRKEKDKDDKEPKSKEEAPEKEVGIGYQKYNPDILILQLWQFVLQLRLGCF
jgi:hypothetical protein